MHWPLLLLLPTLVASPIRVRRGGVDAGIRTDAIAPSLTEEIEDPKECYFKRKRSTSYEDIANRPKTSAVGPCNGPLHRMSSLLDEKVPNLYQAPNPLALVLMRGQGDYEIDWGNEAEVSGVGQRFICKGHVEELLLNWENVRYYHMKRKRVRGSKVPSCSMPHPPFFAHDTTVELSKTRTYFVEADEAEAILVEKAVLVHPGLPVCEEHNNIAKKVLVDYTAKKTGHRIRPRVFRNGLSDTPNIVEDVIPYSQNREFHDPDFRPPRHQNVKLRTTPDASYDAYVDFMTALRLQPSSGRTSWFDLSERHMRRKAGTFNAVTSRIAKYMAPDAPDQLIKYSSRTDALSDFYERERSEDFKTMMQNVRESFELADSRASKLAALSLISHLPLSEIHRYLPSLSDYFYREAKKFARRGFHLEAKQDVRVKYDGRKVDRFIQFTVSHKVTVGLPYGVRRVRDGKGKWQEIPNTLRQLRVGEILSLYKKELNDNNEAELLLPDSTLKKILDICSATRRTSLHGVDMTIAEAMDAMDDSIKMINKLLEEEKIGEEWHGALRMKILQARQYLRTDYLVHAKDRSSIADHCQRFALSDPFEKLFQSDCSNDNGVANANHDHRRICERCESLQILFGDMRATLEDLVSQATTVNEGTMMEQLRREWYHHEETIIKLKAHQLRTAKSEEDRAKIVESLTDGVALVTCDFAMKLLPHFGREATVDFFGQRGLSWHVTNVLTYAHGEYRSHNLIHILVGEKQDSPVVTSIIRHTLTTLKTNGITKVFLRSDQAGAYRSSATISSLPSISEETGVEIIGYYFSEAQAGKSSCDRTSATVKRKVRNTADSGGKVVSPLDFFEAVTTGTLYNGISYYLVKVESADGGAPEISPTKVDDISRLTAFTFEESGVRVHRYLNIGPGRVISTKDFIPNNAVLTVTKEGGKILPDEFWATVGDSRVDEKKEAEKQENEEDSEVCRYDEKTRSDKCEKMRIDTLFRCPLDTCGMEFLSERNLDKHLLIGKHREAPERLNFRDFTLGQYTRFLELVAPQKICKVVDETVAETMDENSNGYVQSMGWAIPPKRKSVRFTDRSKTFIRAIFESGEKTGVKTDPRSAAQLMKESTMATGKLAFLPEELITARQIASLFSTFKREKLGGKEKRKKARPTKKPRRRGQKKEEEIEEMEVDEENEQDEFDEWADEMEKTEGDPDQDWDTEPMFDVEEDVRQEVIRKKDTIFDMSAEIHARILALENKNAPEDKEDVPNPVKNERKRTSFDDELF